MDRFLCTPYIFSSLNIRERRSNSNKFIVRVCGPLARSMMLKLGLEKIEKMGTTRWPKRLLENFSSRIPSNHDVQTVAL